MPLTILNLAYTCFEVVQGQVANLIFETIKIHVECKKQQIARLIGS